MVTRWHSLRRHGRGVAFSPYIGTPDRHSLDRPLGEPQRCASVAARPGADSGDRPKRAVDPQLFGGYSAANVIEMLTNGDMGLPAPVLDGESVLPTPSRPTETRRTRQRNRRARARISASSGASVFARPRRAMAAIDAVYADTPTVSRAIESIVAEGPKSCLPRVATSTILRQKESPRRSKLQRAPRWRSSSLATRPDWSETRWSARPVTGRLSNLPVLSGRC